MVAQGGLEFGRGALAEGGDNGFVLALFLFKAGFEGGEVGAFGSVDAGDLDVRVEAFVDFEKLLGARDFEQTAVEFEVGALMAFSVFLGAYGGGEPVEERVELGEVFVRDAFDGACGGEGFEGGADLKSLHHFVGRHGGDVGTAAGVDFNEALDGELAQGVADGGEADAELVGEVVGEEPLAGEEKTSEDGVTKGFVDFVGSALFTERSQRHVDRLSKI